MGGPFQESPAQHKTRRSIKMLKINHILMLERSSTNRNIR
jgi:hypothetical protein